MFDRIAFRYDLLNRLLSMRRDVAWRKVLFSKLPVGENLRVIDLATGTGDVLLALSGRRNSLGLGVGLDKSANMLAIGLAKIRKNEGAARLSLLRSDAAGMAIKDASFDAATMAFGIRNVPDVSKTLRDIHRVLKPGGRALILEFSLPGNGLIRALYLFYFRQILTRVGGLVSGDRQAYRYLNETVEAFPYGTAFCELMTGAGFKHVEALPLTFGIATLYQGDR